MTWNPLALLYNVPHRWQRAPPELHSPGATECDVCQPWQGERAVAAVVGSGTRTPLSPRKLQPPPPPLSHTHTHIKWERFPTQAEHGNNRWGRLASAPNLPSIRPQLAPSLPPSFPQRAPNLNFPQPPRKSPRNPPQFAPYSPPCAPNFVTTGAAGPPRGSLRSLAGQRPGMFPTRNALALDALEAPSS